ncbi:MAG: G5 domain-containing protein, partial [Bacillota bacterium]
MIPPRGAKRRRLVFFVACSLCLAWLSFGIGESQDAKHSEARLIGLDSSEEHSFYSVYLDQEFLGLTDDPQAVSEALEDSLEFRRLMSGYEVALREDLHFRRETDSSMPKFPPVGAIRAKIEERGTFLTHAICVEIGGERIGAVRDMDRARRVVEDIKESHRRAREESGDVVVSGVEIVEEISFVPHPIEPEEVQDVESVEQILLRGTDEILEHKVQRGDTAWGIAETAGMSIDQLQSANPEMGDLSSLQPGDRVNMVVAEPYITLRTEEVHEYIRYEAFDVVSKEDPEMWPWQTVVEQPGRRGEIAVEARVVMEDGVEISREIVSEERLSRPKTHVVIRGTKTVPQHGSGRFIVPAQGALSSPFGWRAGGFHTGIDLVMSVGTPIRAADGGMVTSAGWQGA